MSNDFDPMRARVLPASPVRRRAGSRIAAVLSCSTLVVGHAAAAASAAPATTAGTCTQTATFWAGPPSASDRCETLIISNACGDPLWIQNTGVGAAFLAPQNQKLLQGQSVAFNVPMAGLASTRFWAKWGCNDSGADCKIGSSDSHCNPVLGCAPPVDTKFEATFGCVWAGTSNSGQCAANPSDPSAQLDSQDNIDMSMVDGFTLPARAALADGRTCIQDGATVTFAPDLTGVFFDGCPAQESIAGFSTQDLQVLSSPFTPAFVAGCFSPCTVLTHDNWNQGNTLDPAGSVAIPYCCSAFQSCHAGAPNFGPFGSGNCPSSCEGAGNITASAFFKAAGTMAPGVYRYAYDDGNSLAQCNGAQGVQGGPPQYRVTFFCPRWASTDSTTQVSNTQAEQAVEFQNCTNRCMAGSSCPDKTACQVPATQVFYPAFNTPPHCVLGTAGCQQIGCCDDHQ